MRTQSYVCVRAEIQLLVLDAIYLPVLFPIEQELFLARVNSMPTRRASAWQAVLTKTIIDNGAIPLFTLKRKMYTY